MVDDPNLRHRARFFYEGVCDLLDKRDFDEPVCFGGTFATELMHFLREICTVKSGKAPADGAED